MANVRFLQSTYLFSTGKTYGFNDEEEILDDKLVEHLQKSEIIDVLKEEVKPQKASSPQKTSPQKAKNEAKNDVN